MRVAIAGAGKVGRAIARELIGNGHQVLLIDRASKTVIVKLSSTPKRVDPLLNAFADTAHEALLRLLAA